MLTEEELNQLAKDFIAGRVFTDRHCDSVQEVGNSFIVLKLMDDKQLDELKAKKPYMFYEYVEKALPRGINGKPMFMSVRCLNEEQTVSLFDKCKRLKAAMDAALTP